MIKRQKNLEKKIAYDRVDILVRKARAQMHGDYERARRYIILAKKIAKRYRLRMPKELRLLFCKKCHYPYRSDRYRVRINKSRVIITCFNCGEERRFPIR